MKNQLYVKRLFNKPYRGRKGISMIAFVFPGQGIQKKGMGKELFDKYPDYVSIANRVLGYSIENLCLENPDNRINFTEYTQVAIYVVNCLAYLEYVKQAGIEPDYVAGHSLGEYNALFAAKVFDFETGLELVKKRGKLMGQVTGGSMAAVIGLSEDDLKAIIKEHSDLKLYISNYNTEKQLIVSGKKEDILRGKELFQDLGIRYSILNVSGAFHSPHMTQPREEFAAVVKEYEFREGVIPVIANVNAMEYNWDHTQDYLIEQINSSVRWTETVKYLLNKGVKHFVEIGNTNILLNMIKSIQSNYVEHSVEEKSGSEISLHDLGSASFRKRYGLAFNCLVGGMYKAISSKEMIASLSKSNLLGFYGTGGVSFEQIKRDISFIKEQVNREVFGVNVVSDVTNSEKEERLIDLLLEEEVSVIEASGYIYLTRPLIRYLAMGLREDNGQVVRTNHIIAKVSRPEIAEIFMKPAPENIISNLLNDNEITSQQATLLRSISVADDICVEADSGGHTDRGIITILLPAIQRMRNRISKEYNYHDVIHVGAAGGIGTPQAAAIMFLLGADFIMTGSINQCSVEAGTSMAVKNILCKMEVQDTDYAPAGDMLEYGSKVQVVKKGTFFVGRANKLYDIYKHCNSIADIEEETREQIERTFFKKKLDEILEEEKEFYKKYREKDYQRLIEDGKFQLLVVLKWYFRNSTKFALEGIQDRKVDYQIQCGKSLGAFNDWVRDTRFSLLENRKVVELNHYIMLETAKYLTMLTK